MDINVIRHKENTENIKFCHTFSHRWGLPLYNLLTWGRSNAERWALNVEIYKFETFLNAGQCPSWLFPGSPGVYIVFFTFS